jgi:hypothetical protein
LLFLKAKKEQSFGQKFQRKPAHKCVIRFSYER